MTYNLMTTAIIKAGKAILYPQHGETVLETLERSGYNPEYQCRQGYCGHCRLKLATGEVQYREFPMAYCHPDEIIACCAQAKTDLEIETELTPESAELYG